MSDPRDAFRDFGILPEGVNSPPPLIRCYLSTGHVLGQFAGVGCFAVLGLGMAVVMIFAFVFPLNLLAALLPLVLFFGLIYMVGRKDHVWIELDGTTIRAKHLYTRKIFERPISDIEELWTVVIRMQGQLGLVVKRILPHLASDPLFVQMFLNEARIAARFDQRNIARISDFGEAAGSYFIAMEFI